MIPLTFLPQTGLAQHIGQHPNKPVRKTKLPQSTQEISGMVYQKNGSPELWCHNDSRNPPVLFRKKTTGSDLSKGNFEEIRLPTLNRDWEDLASDPAGNLYIGDFGNNNNRRRDLRIFIYKPKTGQMDSILFQYPDQTAFPPAKTEDWNFNCEAMVFHGDSLHLFSKNVFVGDFWTKHYVLPARPGQYTAILRDSVLLPGQVVTGAALSQDGRTLALVSYFFGKKRGLFPQSKAAVWFFDDFSGSRFFRGKMTKQKLPKFLVHRQVESIAHFSGKYWLVANEGKLIWKPSIRRLRRK